MAKGQLKSNKEAKKPKQDKAKVSATADFNAGKSPVTVGGKKVG